MSTCQNCHGPHTTWQCPEVRALLFAPFTDVCASCGDQLGWQGEPGALCAACAEYHYTPPRRTPTNPPAEFRTDIVYTRETHEYAMYLDGELVGFARTYHEADLTLNELILTLAIAA